MPGIYVCFVWHMHQPFYKDLMTGEYKLPWTRLHALKDYYGMVKVLEDFPEVHQTFNLVPSMVAQIEEYASGQAADPFLRAALRPAEELSEDEQAFALHYFFQANPSRMIARYPRFQELYEGWLAADRNPKRARRFFTASTMRDLQVLSQVVWFDEEFLASDPEIGELAAKGRDYSRGDQALMGRKQLDILNAVMPAYQSFAAAGQVEITTTPYYHPILPLLCDSNIAGIAHPYVPLPTPFRYPGDARLQLERARTFMKARFGAPPAGLWPSEGSVSDEVFTIAADLGFRWAATDNGVLTRTLGHIADCDHTYKPYLWERDGRQLRVIFRDHYLSDLVGFVYARMNPYEAAAHFLDRIRENCAGILRSGRDALVPVILDGENAWEYYDQNGRPFLRELYRRISHEPGMDALTVSEALERVEAQPVGHIFPGSWINANFDIWIGAEEDNRAWELLLRARQTFDSVVNSPSCTVSEENRKLAWEELLIAEGSDWCWWYGPEHASDNRAEFDHLFRSHLANVYRALGLAPPEELSRPILKTVVEEFHRTPTAPVRATIDGEETSFFEWMGAGVYRVDERSGSMHGQRFHVRELHYGSDSHQLYLRLDFERITPGVRVQFRFPDATWSMELTSSGARLLGDDAPLEIARGRLLEVRVPFSALGVHTGDVVRLQVSLWQGSLPLDSLPREGWLRLETADPGEWRV